MIFGTSRTRRWRHPLERRQELVDEGGVVGGHRIAGFERDLRRRPIAFGDALDDARHADLKLGAHRLVEGAHGPDQPRPVGDDVVPHAGVELADRDHHGLVREVGFAGHQRLERRDDGAPGDDRIDPRPGLRAVRLLALHVDFETVAGGHHRSAPVAENAALEAGEDMDAEDSVDLRVVERPLGDHAFGTRDAFGGRHALLGRLEEQDDLSRQAVAQTGQDLSRGEQHRSVGVVAAGVHDRHALAFVGPGGAARERQVDLLQHRQRIGIGAQRDRRSRKLARDHRDDARAGDRARLEPDRAQALGDELRRLDLAAGELGVLMEMPAPLDQLRLDRRRAAVDLGGERVRAACARARGVSRRRDGGLQREKRSKEKRRERETRGFS